MNYKDELSMRLRQSGIEPTEELLNFIDLETIPLRAKLHTYSRGILKILRGDESEVFAIIHAGQQLRRNKDNQLCFSVPTTVRRSGFRIVPQKAIDRLIDLGFITPSDV